jgi:hypothetical protein
MIIFAGEPMKPGPGVLGILAVGYLTSAVMFCLTEPVYASVKKSKSMPKLCHDSILQGNFSGPKNTCFMDSATIQ